jgi:hypothetical protein
MMWRWLVLAGVSIVVAAPLATRAQDRDTKVRNDRKAFERSRDWIYNDLDAGLQVARRSGKPVMVVFRCIPCVACQEFDDDVARRDPVIRDMLDLFVCVRIVQANAIDLSRFQFDFDQSFAVILMHPDGTIYGRYGTRSHRPEAEDISLQGLRKALEAALALHKNLEAVKPTLAGKLPGPVAYRTPVSYPNLATKYSAALNYEGQVAKSCIHCHQVREAERLLYRSDGKPLPEAVVFPSPDPSLLGLTMDPKEKATVTRVAPNSIAAKAGVRAGDAIETAAGQPLVSVADLQWVLESAPSTVALPIEVRREGKPLAMMLDLPNGWRRGDISWRASTWDLRRMGLGGMRLDDLTDAERVSAGLPRDGLALRVRHAGEFGAHAAAKNAGIQKGDILIAFDQLERHLTESELLAYSLQKKRPGETVSVTFLRHGERKSAKFPLQ